MRATKRKRYVISICLGPHSGKYVWSKIVIKEYSEKAIKVHFWKLSKLKSLAYKNFDININCVKGSKINFKSIAYTLLFSHIFKKRACNVLLPYFNCSTGTIYTIPCFSHVLVSFRPSSELLLHHNHGFVCHQQWNKYVFLKKSYI